MTDDTPDGVLAPDELEPDDDRTRRLEDGRMVVATEGAVGDTPEADEAPAPETDDGETATEGAEPELEGAYGLEIRARAGDGGVERHRVDTDDVSTAFKELLEWYTDRVAGEVSTEQALAVLFENTELRPPGER
jgi:hypothetical protein